MWTDVSAIPPAVKSWANHRFDWVGYLLAALVAITIGLAAYAVDLFDALEFDTVDARYQVRGTREAPPDLAVVAVDDKTFSDLGEQWPFPRSLHGDLIRVLDEAGVKVIAYDVQFTERTTNAEDNALIRAVDAADGVVLATIEVGKNGETNIFGGDEVLQQIGATPANTQIPPSSGGVFRYVPYSTRGLKSFSVVAHEVGSGETVDPDSLDPEGVTIDFHGPAETITTYSFSDVLNGEIPAEKLEGKTVVVGAVSPDLQDVHPTPMGGGELMAGPEIQANAIATLAAGLPLGPAPGAVNVVLIVLLGFVAPMASIRLKQWASLAVAAGAGLLFLIGAQLAFNSGSIVVVVYPLLALIVGYIGSLAIRQLLANRQVRRQERIIAGELPPGAEFAGHTIIELAGRGGMGVLYRAVHTQLGVTRGLKMIAPEYADDEDFRTRFERESRMAASIEHPNVIPINDIGEEDGLLYISMRFIDGKDMSQLIAEKGRLDPRDAVMIVDQVGFALDAAHAAGLIHRDVKPGNVLLEESTRGYHAYLTDFGCTKSTNEATMTATGMIVGTIDFMPPEQFEGSDVDGRADVYALGCLCFRALTGRLPYERDSAQAKIFAHMAADIPKVTELVPSLPVELDDVIEKALAKNRDDRYQTCGELSRAAFQAVEGSIETLDTTLPSDLAPTLKLTPPGVAGAEDKTMIGDIGTSGAEEATRLGQADADMTASDGDENGDGEKTIHRQRPDQD